MHLIIYTNILTPYRKYFYDLVYKACIENGDHFHVLVMAETEPNRTWKYEDLKSDYSILLHNRMIHKGETYIHINNNLKAEIKRLQPDIVVCAGSYLCPGVWQIASLKKELHYKCLYWSESHLKEIKKSNIVKRIVRESLRKWTYRCFDGFWYAGKLSRQFCEKYALRDAQYFFVPNLIDEEKYAVSISMKEKHQIKMEMGLSADKKVFFTPARLSPVKGILEFIDILNKSINKNKVTWLIAGDGELKNQIEEIAKNNGLDVRLLGQKTQSEMRELYAVTDVFLLPSLSDPNPLTCIEALWAKLPLLISEHCGNYPEVVRQVENGYVFSYTSSDEAVMYIERLIQADDRCFQKAGEISREIAETMYNSKATTKLIIEEMRKLCSKN